MRTVRAILAFAPLALAACAAEPGRSPAAGEPPPHPLVWDAMEKVLEPKPGEGAADFVFKVTNTSDRAVTISEVRPSCACTLLELPRMPWLLAPGASGSVVATVDFSGKDGWLTKSLAVNSTAGRQTLFMRVNIPARDQAARERNQKLAQANRQAVFRGGCAECHAASAAGKQGQELFLAACAVCHVTPHRASMVPDLLVARTHRDAAYWRKWITEGREQSLMPAFAQEAGGPLTEPQIESLVAFALSQLPTEPRRN